MKETFFKRKFIINITDHIFQSRNNENITRGFNYDYNDIKEIIYLSIRNGLTSFRNKGVTLIKFKKDDDKYSFMILEMTGTAKNPVINVVSILDSHSKDINFRPYSYIKNRIFLISFIIEQKYSLKVVKSENIKRNKIVIKKKLSKF